MYRINAQKDYAYNEYSMREAPDLSPGEVKQNSQFGDIYEETYDAQQIGPDLTAEGAMWGSFRGMPDDTIDNTGGGMLNEEQRGIVWEGFSDFLKMRILNPQTGSAQRKGLENMYDETRRRIRTNQTEVSGLALRWYLSSIGRANCERNGGLGRGSGPTERGTCDGLLPLNLNYGCWCHAEDDDVFKGSGAFVDGFDKVCKQMKQCLRCVRHDAREANQVCDPASQKYMLSQSFTHRGVLQECASVNQDDCSVHTCCCEVEFTRGILNLFMVEGAVLNDAYQHKDGNGFDWDANCSVGPGPGLTRECCGAYPERRMYATEKMQCCHDRSVFNPLTKVCCADGTAANSVADCENRRKRKRRRK